jgi:hypothetical protein
MKKLILLSLSAWAFSASAQAPFPTMDSVDINNISASVLVHGDLWWNPTLGVADCSFPKGSSKNINFAGALWMSGYDGSGNLHVAAQTYRQTGNDYWPGPLDAHDTLTYATSSAWAKIWKVNQTDIDAFLALPTHTTTNTPAAILTWPANGNAYAQGNGGVPLTISTVMAPFVDVNGDGIYEPLLGEYPAIRGDQALWWVFSDNGPAHTETKGRPLGIEVHAMAYAYSRGTLIDDVIYYDYEIFSHSINFYHNFRIGMFDDMDLGYYGDDYIGFDSSHRMGVTYNGTTCDGCSAGSPVNSYGRDIPIAGVSMIVLPGDSASSVAPAGSFTTYTNDASVFGNPVADTAYDHYLRSENRAGQHFTNTFSGAGLPCLVQGAGPNTNYLYTGDPSNPGQWSECNCNNDPGDRRFIIASNDFSVLPGSVNHVVMALVTTNPDTNNACPQASFANIKTVADTAWYIYNNPLPPLPPSGVSMVNLNSRIALYPNPAHNQLFIESSASSNATETIEIYNIIGQKEKVTFNKTANTSVADISALPAGLHIVMYNDGVGQANVKFVKE